MTSSTIPDHRPAPERVGPASRSFADLDDAIAHWHNAVLDLQRDFDDAAREFEAVVAKIRGVVPQLNRARRHLDALLAQRERRLSVRRVRPERDSGSAPRLGVTRSGASPGGLCTPTWPLMLSSMT